MRCLDCVRRLGLSVAIALITVLPTAPSSAATLEGVSFSDRLEVEGTPLSLHGLALFRYRVFFRAYVAALYLSEPADARRPLADVPRRLELSYFWGIAGPDFGRSADVLLARNVAPERLAALRPRIERIASLYRDVEPGDRYSLTYVPGRGTELALNGERLGVIPGADFAAAYFAIWLGRDPLDADLRDALLSGSR